MNETSDQPGMDQDPTAVKAEWITAAHELVNQVEGWCREMEWSTRQAPKRLDDTPIGVYEVPMLLIQNWDTRLLLEPVTRFGNKNDGQFDLYVMPAYDDLAVIVRRNGSWWLKEQRTHTESLETALTKDSLTSLVEAFRARHAQAG